MLSDEQMRKIWPFSLLNDEQMSNKVGVKHQPVLEIHFQRISLLPPVPVGAWRTTPWRTVVGIFVAPGVDVKWAIHVFLYILSGQIIATSHDLTPKGS